VAFSLPFCFLVRNDRCRRWDSQHEVGTEGRGIEGGVYIKAQWAYWCCPRRMDRGKEGDRLRASTEQVPHLARTADATRNQRSPVTSHLRARYATPRAAEMKERVNHQ